MDPNIIGMAMQNAMFTAQTTTTWTTPFIKTDKDVIPYFDNIDDLRYIVQSAIGFDLEGIQ